MKLASKLKSKPGVYKITNLVNRKVYIGSSNNLSSRFRKLGIPNPSSEAKKYLIS